MRKSETIKNVGLIISIIIIICLSIYIFILKLFANVDNDYKKLGLKIEYYDIEYITTYGPEYKKIAEQLGDYVSCDADILPSKQVVVVYPSGETGFFSPMGDMVCPFQLVYQILNGLNHQREKNII